MKKKCKKENLEEELFEKGDNKRVDMPKRRKSKKEQGITLIALVITIIIMLILAGVTLNTVLGEHGLFQRAKKATEAYKKAEADESKQIEELIEMMDGENDGTGGTNPGEPTNPDPDPDPEPDTNTTTDPGDDPNAGTAGDLKDKVEGDGSIIGEKVTGLETNGLTQCQQLKKKKRFYTNFFFF